MSNLPENIKSVTKGRTLVGVVPVHMYEPLEFGMPWDDTLMPIAPNYTALQNAVHNCILAGCDSIWIVVNDNTKPLVKSVIGEAWKENSYRTSMFYDDKLYRTIPIYYAPISPWDRDARDSHAWAALYGCYISRKIALKVSHWIEPERYFISWPMGVYPFPSNVREQIKGKQKNIVLTYHNQSVKTGEYLAFTIEWKEVLRLIRRIWHNSTLRYNWFDELLPYKEQFSARWFGVEEVFDDLDISYHVKLEVDDYYRIDTWEGYRQFMTCADFVERPSDEVLKYREFKGVGSYSDDVD